VGFRINTALFAHDAKNHKTDDDSVALQLNSRQLIDHTPIASFR